MVACDDALSFAMGAWISFFDYSLERVLAG